jgi:hypothetical protein
MILNPWEAGAEYRSGDYVEDPTNHRVYRVICPEHKDEWNCQVFANRLQPHNNHEQFVLATDEETR